MNESSLSIPPAKPERSCVRDAALPLLPPALAARRVFIGSGDDVVAAYRTADAALARAADRTPVVLVHSVNAAASAAEVRPIFEALARTRPVLALELPGFGSSPRDAKPHTPQRMTDAVLMAVDEARQISRRGAVDLLGVSLSCEFVARAALTRPNWIRSVLLVSPTGLESRRLEPDEGGRSKDKPWLRALLERGPWADALFRALTSERSMRRFLERAWGSENIDETLLAYNLQTVRPRGARHAPYDFIAGALFTRGVARLYERLPQPVWLAHGTRGSFSRFDGLQSIRPLSNWTIDSFEAGAMPYFESPAAFMSRMAAFLARIEPGQSMATRESVGEVV